MESEEQPFTPKDVDDQIDRASQAAPMLPQSVPEAPEFPILPALRALYSAETQQMTDALERGRERLAEGEQAWLALQQKDGHISDHSSILAEQGGRGKPALQRFLGARGWPTRLAGLAAAVLLVTLVGSLVAGLVLVRHSATGAVGKKNTASQPTATAISAPAQQNLYLLSDPDAWITKFDPIARTVLWTYKWHAPFDPTHGSYGLGFGGMLAGDGSFYFAAGVSTGQDGITASLYAVDAQRGTLRWHWKQSGNAYPVLVEPGVVYVTAADGLYALNASNGSTRWHASVDVGLGDLVLGNGILYGTFQTNATDPWSSSLFAVNSSDGTLLWQSALPEGRYFSVSAVVNGTLYLTSVEEKYKTNALSVMGDGKPKISYAYAYSLDGKQLWQSQRFDGYIDGLTLAGGIIYSASFGNNASTLAFALNPKDGTMLWHYQTEAGASLNSGPIIANGTVYIETGPPSSNSTTPNVLIALDSQSGAVRWKQKLDLPAYQLSSSCVLANGVFYIITGGFAPSSLSAFSAENGAPLWQMSLGSAYEAWIVAAAP